MLIVRRSDIFDPFSFDLWDPIQGFPFDAFRSLAETRPGFVSDTSAFANTRIDWKEAPEAHIFKVDLPGVKKEEVKLEEEGRVLQISGERSGEKEEKNDKWHRVERNSGKFLRRFRLPENAKVGQVKASMENGVLTLTVPKEEVKKSDVKLIEISGGFVSDTSAFANTRIDWKETPEAHIFKADLPGVNKEEVKLEVEKVGRVLQISGERSREKEEKNDKWHRVERNSGKFLRRFRLPENAKVFQVKASMENGVLALTVPKEEVKKSDVKLIEISGN